MRVLLVGGYNRADSLASAADGFELIGGECGFVFTLSLYNEGRRRPEAVWEGLRDARPDRYDVVLLWNPKAELRPEMVRWLTTQAPTLYWSIDDPEFEERGTTLRRECHGAVTCCQGSMERYRRTMPAITLYPPINVKAGAHAWGPRPDWTCQVGFYATNCYTTDEFPEMLESRAAIASAVLELGVSFKAFGFWDERPAGWARAGRLTSRAHFGGWVPGREIPRVVASCQINLNSHVRPRGYRYYNERVFEVLGSGGFLLCDRVNGIEEDFIDGEHVALWGDLKELQDRIRYYLAHEEQRRRIAAQGQRLACALYSNIRFAESIARFVEHVR